MIENKRFILFMYLFICRQYDQDFFKEMQEETGVDLENIVYYKDEVFISKICCDIGMWSKLCSIDENLVVFL